jgi:hypothetical protein
VRRTTGKSPVDREFIALRKLVSANSHVLAVDVRQFFLPAGTISRSSVYKSATSAHIGTAAMMALQDQQEEHLVNFSAAAGYDLRLLPEVLISSG